MFVLQLQPLISATPCLQVFHGKFFRIPQLGTSIHFHSGLGDCLTHQKNTIIGIFVFTKNHCVMVTSTVMTTSMAQPSVPSGNSLDSSGPTSNNTHLVTPSCNSNSVVVISPSKMKEEEKRLQSVSQTKLHSYVLNI